MTRRRRTRAADVADEDEHIETSTPVRSRSAQPRRRRRAHRPQAESEGEASSTDVEAISNDLTASSTTNNDSTTSKKRTHDTITESEEKGEVQPLAKRTRRSRMITETPSKVKDTIEKKVVTTQHLKKPVNEEGDVYFNNEDSNSDSDHDDEHSCNYAEIQDDELLAKTPKKTKDIDLNVTSPVRRRRKAVVESTMLVEETRTEELDLSCSAEVVVLRNAVLSSLVYQRDRILLPSVPSLQSLIRRSASCMAYGVAPVQAMIRSLSLDAVSIQSNHAIQAVVRSSLFNEDKFTNVDKILAVIRFSPNQCRRVEQSSILALQAISVGVSVVPLSKKLPLSYLQALIRCRNLRTPCDCSVHPIQAAVRYKNLEVISSSTVEILQSVMKGHNKTRESVGVVLKSLRSLQASVWQHLTESHGQDEGSIVNLQAHITTRNVLSASKTIPTLSTFQSLIRMRHNSISIDEISTLQAVLRLMPTLDYAGIICLQAVIATALSRDTTNEFGELCNVAEAFIRSCSHTERLDVSPLQATCRYRNIQNAWNIDELPSIKSSNHLLQSIIRCLALAKEDISLPISGIQATAYRALCTDNDKAVNIIQAFLLCRKSKYDIEPVSQLQSSIMLHLTLSDLANKNRFAAKIQRAFRGYVIRQRYEIATSADLLQRQIRQAFITTPGGNLDEELRKHENIIHEKEESYATFGSQFKKGIQYLWDTITSLTPSKKRSRSEMEGDIVTPTPDKRRRVDNKFNKRLIELNQDQSPSNTDRIKQLELERLKMDSILLQEIEDDKKKKDIKVECSSNDATPLKNEKFSEVSFVTSPKDKVETPKKGFGNPFSFLSPFSFFSPSKTKPVEVRAIPFSSRLAESEKNRIYTSNAQHIDLEKSNVVSRIKSRQPTPFKKRSRQAYETDGEIREENMDDYVEWTENKKPRLLFDSPVSSPTTPSKHYQKNKTGKSVQWRDGYDKRTRTGNGEEESFLVEDIHNFRFSPHHDSVPSSSISGILKTSNRTDNRTYVNKKGNSLAKRPPLFHTIQSTQSTTKWLRRESKQTSSYLDDSAIHDLGI